MNAWRQLVCGLMAAMGGSVGLVQYQSLHDQNEVLFRQLQQVISGTASARRDA